MEINLFRFMRVGIGIFLQGRIGGEDVSKVLGDLIDIMAHECLMQVRNQVLNRLMWHWMVVGN